MVLTEQDINELSYLTLELFKYQNSSSYFILENAISKKFLVEFYLLEDLDDDEDVVEDADNSLEEVKDYAMNVGESDDFFSGLNRLMKVYSFLKKAFKIKNIPGIAAIVASVAHMLKLPARAKLQKLEVDAAEWAQKITDNPKYQNELIRFYTKTGGQIVHFGNSYDKIISQYKTYVHDNVKKLITSESIFKRFKGKLLNIWVNKFKMDKPLAIKLANMIESLKFAAKNHPILAMFSVALIIGIIIVSIFNWAKIKRWLKSIGKFITAPFRVFYKYLKKMFSIFKRSGGTTNEQEI